MDGRIGTVTSREFARNVSAAKRAAAECGTVLVTDRGEAAFALLTIAEYRRLAGRGRNMAELLAWPEADDLELEAELARIRARGHDG